MSEWKDVKLGDVSTKIGSGATPKGGSKSYKEFGIALIRSQNVLDFQFTTSGLAFIDDMQADALKNVEVAQNDVLLNITGDSVARCCIVPGYVLPARVNQHVSIIRLDTQSADYRFIFYQLQFLKDELLMQSEVGATRKALTKGMLENLEMTLPPLEEQETIAGILSSLDDKIDLLHRQNQTLENIAQALFRHWFIDNAQDDWEELELGEILKVVGGTTPSTKNPEYWDGDIHWTTPRDLSANDSPYLLDTARKITESGLSKISSGLLPRGTLLLSSRAPIGYLAFSEVPIAINQGYIAIVENKRVSNLFIYFWLKENMDYVRSYANGSTFLEISKSAFRRLKIAFPPRQLRTIFENLVNPSFEKIRANLYQINTLEKLRDTLLPKLMSGEVRVRFPRSDHI